MLKYNPNLKHIARSLRAEMTPSELMLWSRLRKKQLCGVQFYRQKPIGAYIADFYTPKAKLVVEVDGSQHLDPEQRQNDAERDACLASEGLRILRFSNMQVLQELDVVVGVILQVLVEQRGGGNPPYPPLPKGEISLYTSYISGCSHLSSRP
jgi:very-short-patch-repair endonuclease